MIVPDEPAQSPEGGNESAPNTGEDSKTFQTDISETDDEGTTVREAEVREDDLNETNKPKPDSEP
ncbi:hypothetical protein M3I53_07375 [Paraburkholderia sp. CNPSo 3272]|uniref:hypothetical protein n=1 Tax=Paraburkholderia sp. CNPSo 3272 TaxID=2940931 RepID=UPI0020B77A1C|nr:hypothetical protein [Paraburkholderia sp. CNPSo 3272]MCP3722950.1 hypothetical protein [Paraburkholderia sp. CNPSo 3272]